jgi:molybdenum cofactor biosynthesis protein A
MVLSQIPTTFLKRCHPCIYSSSRHLLRKELGRGGSRTSQRIEKHDFSSLAKLHVDDDNDESNQSNQDYETAKIQIIKGGSEMEMKNMPRLQQLRKRLANDNGPGVGTSLLNASNAISPNTSNKSAKNLGVEVTNHKLKQTSGDRNKITWREALATAKEGLSQNEHVHVLTDAYSRKHSYLRISLGERCNLRCLYCMPPEGVPLQSNEKILNADEISRLVKLFTARGVDKVRLTGGEPLLRKDISQIISSIATEPTINSIGITTNGITLTRQLPSLVENGLTHANISLDTLQADKFLEITRRNGLSQVMKAIENASEQLPKGNVKINCVVMKGFNDNELRDFIHLTRDLPVDIRFIEWMPFNDNGWNKDRFLSYADMMKMITSDVLNHPHEGTMQGLPSFELNRLEDGPNDTTKWWQVPGHIGRVGFITSMTEHFCGDCNRLRITADGQLKVCLFGSAEVSLRDAMREGASDNDMESIIWAALQNKHFALGGHGNAEGIRKANDNRPMTLIGG